MPEKVTSIVCSTLFRVLLPLTLLAAAVLRFNALSFMYLVCLLITPLLPYPMASSMAGATGRFLKAMIGLSALPVLTHIVFHITLVAIATDSEPYGSMLSNCSDNEMLARQIGFQRLDGVPYYHVMRLVVPDVAVLAVSIIVLVVSTILIRRDSHEQSDLPLTGSYIRRKHKMASAINYLGEFFVGLLLAASGIMVPSVLSSVYFLVFLVLGILWACYQSLGTRFAHFRIVLLIYTGAHILVLHLYQFQFFQDVLPTDSLIARLLGLTGVIVTDCNQVYTVNFSPDARWMAYVNPGVLLILYWLLACETRYWFRTKDLSQEDLLEGSAFTSPKRRHKRKRPTNVERQVPSSKDLDETGSLVFSGSTYGDDGGDEERLVEEGENVNYSSIDPTDGEDRDSRRSQGSEAQSVDGKRRQDKDSKRAPLVSVFMMMMRQSYVIMLIAMMAWSILYLSWLTFALLLYACLLWMLPNSRRACLVSSPLLVLYVVALLLAQYVFNMDLEKELPTKAGIMQVDEIGLFRFATPPKDLAIQTLFSMFFLMTLRQFMRERRVSNSPQTAGYPMYARGSERPIESLGDLMSQCLMEVLCKYWIFVCAGMLLLMAVQEVVIYRIIYMVLFLLFVICFQVSYPLWRALMFVFWWLVIVYSMVVLIIIYTFQFEQFPGYWMNGTGWDNTTLADIGLEEYGGTDLFIKLLTPTSFLIVIILQVHYFHKPFLRLSALDRFRREEDVEADTKYSRWLEHWGTTPTDTETEDEDTQGSKSYQRGFKMWLIRTRLLLRILQFWQSLTCFLWRLAEIHIFKVVIVLTMYVAVQEDQVSALTAVYVILVALLLPFVLSKAHLVLSNLIVLWTCLVILAKMLYQLRIVIPPVQEACDALNNTAGQLLPKSMDNFVWLGFRKISGGESIDSYIMLYIVVLLVVLFESIVRYHQRQHFAHPDTPKLEDGIIFHNIHRENADRDLLSCLKFFANYAFYKFGLEICYVATAVTVCIRMDIFGVLYTVLLAIMMLLSRRASSRVWWLYMLILAILLPIQFLGALGFPPIACIVYPWNNVTHFNANLERWLFLPDPVESPPAYALLSDAIQLLFVVLQWRVFRLEAANRSQDHSGGDNDEILLEVEAGKPIPVEDFTLTSSSYLDVLKLAVFEYMFWVTLAIIFISGATRINIFGLGYVIAVFCFMWYGKEFLLKPLRKLLRMWNFLIAYVVFVLFAKACLQLVGCVYIRHLFSSSCWVIQLFGINCLLPNQDSESIIKAARGENCLIVEDNTGMSWDVVCFAFLLLQRRIYSSHYFRHVVDLLEAQSRLSSRGAELINRILIREVKKQKEEEALILENIKEKMKALKERQAALRKDFKEPTDHFQAIRAGDYYLFEEGGDEQLDKTDGKVPDSLTFGRDDADHDKRLGPLQVISTAMDHGADAAVDKVKQQDQPQGATPMIEGDVDKEEEPEDPAVVEKAKSWGSFFTTLLGSIADWLIRLCNRISRNYRLVADKLEGELRVEKEKIKSERTQCVLERSGSSEGGGDTSPSADLVEVTVEPVDTMDCALAQSSQSLDELEARAQDKEKEFEQSQPHAYRLVVAVVYMLISRSELLCYFLMILDQMVYGSLLSLPLPFMVFLWGMLSVPRPSKSFWITVITYTEVVVVTKYLFQFGFFPWNDGTVQESPFYPPRILGIEQKENYANVDIALLLALFIHRSILKKYGLWKDSKDINEDMARAGRHEKTPMDGQVDTSAMPVDTDGSPDEVREQREDGELEEGHAEQEQVEEEPGRLKKGFQTVVGPVVRFFKEMIGSTYNATVDVYAPMFLCDFINFFIVVFGYQSFGPALESADGDVTSYISENRIPVPFLVMLIFQFVLIVIDRALFLRKNVIGKCVFQILLVIFIHVWFFFVLPKVTGRSFFDNIPAQLWYFIKCIYFALSAYQIRCGYPTRILGNFLTKKYNYLNLFLFKGFLAIPFLLELRALMDWIWTDSTLAIGSWLQMEDIYANIFILKCWRHAESSYPTPRSQKKKAAIKYGVGGLLLFIIILIIWFPLVIFAFANTVFNPNPPSEVTIQLSLGAYQPLFKMTVQQNIAEITDAEFSSLKHHFRQDRSAVSFLNRFELADVTVISFSGESTAIWGISEPAQREMVQALSQQDKLMLEFAINIIRSSDTKSTDTLTTYFETGVTELLTLAEVINGTSNATVRVNDVFPRFMQVSTKGITAAMPLISGEDGFGNSNLTLGLSGDPGIGSLNQYWSIQEEVYDGSHFILVKENPSFTDQIKLVTFNDRKAPSTLSFLSGYGIIGLYVSFILLIGRFLRMATTGQYLTIIFRELPMVDNVLQLCLDIYLVREMKEFHLEEDLYAKLIFLYRSPETMVKWTRAKPKTD